MKIKAPGEPMLLFRTKIGVRHKQSVVRADLDETIPVVGETGGTGNRLPMCRCVSA